MKVFRILSLAVRFAPRFIRVRRGTWIALGLGFLILLFLLIWAALSLLGWLWSQGKSLIGGTPEAIRSIASQVEQAVPGAREALGAVVPTLKPEAPPRDVSGTDIGPVTRYAGLVRSHWHRDGREITVRYEGRADYTAVLDHYAQGFAAQGFVQNVISATPETEVHDYLKGNERVRFEIARLPQGKVKATIVAVLP